MSETHKFYVQKIKTNYIVFLISLKKVNFKMDDLLNVYIHIDMDAYYA